MNMRDPLWQFVGVVLAIIALVVTIIIYFRQRSIKRLIAETSTQIPLVRLAGQGFTGLRVLYNERQIQNALLIVVDIVSAGNIPILSADFESPLILTAEESATILSAKVGKCVPEHLPVTLTTSDNSVSIQPMLLNPNDEFQVQLLVENSRGLIEAKGRIAGVKAIQPRRPTSYWYPAIAIMGLLLAIGSVVLDPYFTLKPTTATPREEYPYVACAMLGILAMVIPTFMQTKLSLSQLLTKITLKV